MEHGAHRRIASYELLRIIAMFMVIVLHYVSQTQSLAVPGTELTPTRMMGGLLESFCIVAVNVYVLISGYFLTEAQYKVARLVRLLAQILFYSLLIPLAMACLHMTIYGRGVWKMAEYFLPVSMEHYWFASAYVLMYLFAPLLNAAVHRMSRLQLKSVIILLLIFFCGIKSISPVQLSTDRMGYDFGWFLCLYLLAAYIRLYDIPRFDHPLKAGLTYVISCLLIYGLHIGLHLMNEKTGQLQYYATVPFHYNSFLCLVASIGFFYLFKFVHLDDNRLPGILATAVAPFTFGVYLIHEHVDIRDKWAVWMANIVGGTWQDAPVRFLLQTAAASLILYLACIFVDYLRSIIFAFAERSLSRTKPAAALRRLDALFAASKDGMAEQM